MKILLPALPDYHSSDNDSLTKVNRRLADDKISANQIKTSDPFTHLVEAMREDMLRKYSNPQYKWIHKCEVLVGSRTDPAWPIVGPLF